MASSSKSPASVEEADAELFPFDEAGAGWVEARTSCDHLEFIATDHGHLPPPDSPCARCQDHSENWVCLCCKDVLCSRFVNQHMLQHYQDSKHCLALSYSDISVWCFECNAYLDAQVILPLRAPYETAYIMKFGEAPPLRSLEFS